MWQLGNGYSSAVYSILLKIKDIWTSNIWVESNFFMIILAYSFWNFSFNIVQIKYKINIAMKQFYDKYFDEKKLKFQLKKCTYTYWNILCLGFLENNNKMVEQLNCSCYLADIDTGAHNFW